MKLRNDLPGKNSPADLHIYQLTQNEQVPCAHIYPESQVFTPDSRFVVLHCHANPHGGDSQNPLHQYLLCDLEDNGRLIPLTDEPGVTGPAISPDGCFFYYFVNQTHQTPRRLLLKKLNLATRELTTISVVDQKIRGTHFRVFDRVYGLSTIRSDGQKIVTAVFMGDGRQSNPHWGLLVFDLKSGDYHLIVHGPSWCNLHPQYCRSTDPNHLQDLMIQENHGCVVSPSGEVIQLVQNPGCDIHVVRDDGSHFRSMPWGRTSTEHCRGHQCWRGTSEFGIASINVTNASGEEEIHLIEAISQEHTDHLGKLMPNAVYNDLTRDRENPRYDHFATDPTGQWLISDGLYPDGWRIELSQLKRPGVDPLAPSQYLLHTNAKTKSGPENMHHPHPCFSPDGKKVFFNSTESGVLQAYMLTNLPLDHSAPAPRHAVAPDQPSLTLV